jgi:hypothetical protein
MNDQNALLEQLRDVDLPEVSGGIPWGWIAFAIVCALLLVAVRQIKAASERRYKRMLWHREAKAELASIRDDVVTQSSNELLARCSTLARKVMLVAEPRENVAALHGDTWLAKLDDVCAKPVFTQGMGRLLIEYPYQKTASIPPDDMQSLFNSLETLIAAAPTHQPRSANAPEPSSSQQLGVDVQLNQSSKGN